MDDHDPITQFFPDSEEVDLYEVLGVKHEASQDDLKRSYRKMALLYHPDKHASASEETRNASSQKFQQIGFAYTVLGDAKRRKRYDETGKTDEGFENLAGEDGWDAYFEQLFERVTAQKLDQMKKEYQGSSEELQDLRDAHNETQGSIEQIMTLIPHSTFLDEDRFVIIIADQIHKGELKSLPAWKKGLKDEKKKMQRKREGEKEASEAEALAKELGVWDEFFGSGKPGKRRRDDKSKKNDDADDEEGDTSALQALILSKRKNATSFLDGLAEKYGAAGEKGKSKRGKRRQSNIDEDGESPKKRGKPAVVDEPDIDDTEWAALQNKLFDNKPEPKNHRKSRRKA